jgi:hypothetical protein
MKILESSFNPEASKVMEDIEQVRKIFLYQVNVAMFSSKVLLRFTYFSVTDWNRNWFCIG